MPYQQHPQEPSKSYERELGAIQQRLSSQDETLERLEQKMDDIQAFMQAHKGGVRMLVMLGSAAGAVGAGIAWIWSTFGGTHTGS